LLCCAAEFVANRLMTWCEKKRNAVYAGESYERIDDPGKQCGTAAKDGCNQIELEKANQKPVECATITSVRESFETAFMMFSGILRS
jgi:hypothetical protein